ncbi:MAG: adenylosuccinate lyase family protein [Pigmentiphaga sp.]|uniref:class-II fumarase/aspartase family protein n=1 Tax=Pigmentiphaga sp. TaxID=1977564 RepID=UPI0029B1304E|nr:adenylosuccinate lyase family protein [Pigmentiphaga sp.]MDX3904291.1 adenylosuccinate lyase family protein [Pigmentiphaga sp.]
MSTSLIDSRIFGDMFGTAKMRQVFCDEALIDRYVEVEAALARAQARVGIIPGQAATDIARAAGAFTADIDRLARETLIVGYPILPLVRQLSEAAGEAGRYVHWGATTQDIMDTALVLQLRQAIGELEKQTGMLQATLARLAQDHRETLMAGRTHLQHALPITFGYKAAVWLSMFDRHMARLRELKPRLLVGSFSGAAGTLASLGSQGLQVQRALCEELDLGVPAITWHVARDNLAEAVGFLALLTGSLAKIATDVSLMMANEFGEVAEPFVPGRGASSTMPQKRNPISCEVIIANAKAVRQNAALMFDAAVHDFERSTGPWQAEWLAIPQSFVLTAGALANAVFMLEGLTVDKQRMRQNLDITGGLIVAEAIMMAAASVLGRQAAHERVYEACKQAAENARPLSQVLAEQADICDALGGAAGIERLCGPESYLGSTLAMVDGLLMAGGRLSGTSSEGRPA